MNKIFVRNGILYINGYSGNGTIKHFVSENDTKISIFDSSQNMPIIQNILVTSIFSDSAGTLNYADINELELILAPFFVNATGDGGTGTEYILKEFVLRNTNLFSRISTMTSQYFQDFGKASGESLLNSQNYNRAIFTLTENSIEIYKGQFADFNSFVAWCTANLQDDGFGELKYDTTVKVSFNQNLPKFGKFWAYNEGYAFIKGHGNLNNFKVKTNIFFNQDNYDVIYAASGMPSFTTFAHLKTCWFQRKSSSLYNGNNITGAIKTKAFPYFASDGERKVVRLSDKAVFTMATLPNFAGNSTFVLTNQGSLFQVNSNLPGGVGQIQQYPRSDVYIGLNNLVRFHVYKWENLGETYMFLEPKPVGYDTFDLGLVDKSKYKLFGLFTGKRGNDIIRELNPIPSTSPNSNMVSWKVKKTDIARYMVDAGGSNSSPDPSQMKDCQLFYMDAEGNASFFSTKIIAEINSRGAKFKLSLAR